MYLTILVVVILFFYMFTLENVGNYIPDPKGEVRTPFQYTHTDRTQLGMYHDFSSIMGLAFYDTLPRISLVAAQVLVGAGCDRRKKSPSELVDMMGRLNNDDEKYDPRDDRIDYSHDFFDYSVSEGVAEPFMPTVE